MDAPPDYRFLLANERTFLAYVRTALALQVAGLGVLQFLTHSHDAVRYTLGLALVLAGSFVGVSGYRRFRDNETRSAPGATCAPPAGPPWSPWRSPRCRWPPPWC